MWDGKKFETGLTPRYDDWCRNRDEPLEVSAVTRVSDRAYVAGRRGNDTPIRASCPSGAMGFTEPRLGS